MIEWAKGVYSERKVIIMCSHNIIMIYECDEYTGR